MKYMQTVNLIIPSVVVTKKQNKWYMLESRTFMPRVYFIIVLFEKQRGYTGLLNRIQKKVYGIYLCIPSTTPLIILSGYGFCKNRLKKLGMFFSSIFYNNSSKMWIYYQIVFSIKELKNLNIIFKKEYKIFQYENGHPIKTFFYKGMWKFWMHYHLLCS